MLGGSVRYYVDLRVPWYRIHKLFLKQYAELYRRYPQAPRSYWAVVSTLKSILG